jgi:ribonuclease HI
MARKKKAPKVSHSDPIVIYTDGSAYPDGKGGYAAIAPDVGVVVCGNDTDTTNNKMEITAVARGLAQLEPGREIIVKSDSQYVTKAFTDGWMDNWKKRNWKSSTGAPVKNRDEWEELNSEIERHTKVSFEWVKGHNGDPGNEAADDLAEHAVQQLSR